MWLNSSTTKYAHAAIWNDGIGNTTITNTKVFCSNYGYCIYNGNQTSPTGGTVTINGTSRIGTHPSNKYKYVIRLMAQTTLKVSDSARILAGGNCERFPFESFTSSNVEFTSTSSFNSISTSATLMNFLDASTLKFNTDGYLYCGGPYIFQSGSNPVSLTLQKGKFVARTSNSLSKNTGGSNIPVASGPANRSFWYMDAYNSTGDSLKTISNCYYYAK